MINPFKAFVMLMWFLFVLIIVTPLAVGVILLINVWDAVRETFVDDFYRDLWPFFQKECKSAWRYVKGDSK